MTNPTTIARSLSEAQRVSAAVEAMRDDPFIDDIPLLGTSQQDARMEHYASLAVRAVILAEREGGA